MADDKDALDTLAPEIRFKGFTDAWVQRKLGEVADITKLAGFEFTKYVTYSDYGEIIALRGLNVKNGELMLDNVKYIDESDFSKLSRSKLYKHDILFTYVGTVGELAVVQKNDKYYLAPNVARIRLKDNVNPLFISQQMGDSSFYDNVIFPLIATSSQPALSMENVRKFEIQLTTKSEQTSIGNFFRTLDDTITLYKRKLDGLKKLKNGYLQQMFPQAGENVPRVRFAGFTESWKHRKLGEVVEKVKSYSLSRDIETEEATGYRYIHYGDIHKQVADFIIYDEQLPHIKHGNYLPLNQGDLVLADASEDYVGIAEPCVILHEPSDKIIAGLHTIALRPHNADSLYLYYLLHTEKFKKYGGEVGTGLKVFGITYNNLALYETQLPTLPEQIAIGNFLRNLDEQIATQQTKLDKLKQLKTAYLQKMFL